MNIMIMAGMGFAGSIIAFDHLIHELPNWLAVVLYSSAMILLIAGMIKKKKETRD